MPGFELTRFCKFKGCSHGFEIFSVGRVSFHRNWVRRLELTRARNSRPTSLNRMPGLRYTPHTCTPAPKWPPFKLPCSGICGARQGSNSVMQIMLKIQLWISEPDPKLSPPFRSSELSSVPPSAPVAATEKKQRPRRFPDDVVGSAIKMPKSVVLVALLLIAAGLKESQQHWRRVRLCQPRYVGRVPAHSLRTANQGWPLAVSALVSLDYWAGSPSLW